MTLAVAMAAPAAAYEEIAVKDGGTLTGVVKFAGPPPKLEPLAVNKNRDVCGEQKPSEALVVSADGGVRGSVVLIEGVARGKKATGDVVVDNHRCVFVSHVTAATPGERVRIKNSDPILHNTHGFLGKPTVFNLALPNRDQMIDITKRLTKPGVVRVLCDAHPHMFAWMIVHDSPYVAVTDDQGAFRIDGIPPGAYKVTMWHEGFRARGVDKDGRPQFDEPRTVTKDITIAPKGSATVEFELK
ncbi:MAG TPA: carboxypeptidase regulatory-like domain-containing protein [Methylomirabilota bacterium]|jgi:plastocyanin|nr:carboxypeptidase regulatory-like domain-containing protein [Methylomirabilota bacterium]